MIIISTGSLTLLSVNEIAAILAHERAHLESKDTLAAATMSFTAIINNLIIRFGLILMYPVRYFRIRAWLLLIIVTVFLCWIKYFAPFLIMAAWIFPAVALIIFRKIISPLELFISRRTEYARDTYVHDVGLGEHLRSALPKTTKQENSEPPSRWEIMFRHTHPLTHDRIRRIDKLTMKNNYSCLTNC